MSTLTQEKIVDSPHTDVDAHYPEASKLIGSTLAHVESLSDDEANRRFDAMVETAKRIHLPGLVREDAVEDLVEAVPEVNVLIQKIHDTADTILTETSLDSNSTVMANNLGIAADITGDPEILERAIDALEDTRDSSIDSIRVAMMIAHHDHEQYTVVRERMKRQVKEAELARVATKPPMMHERDESYPNDSELESHLSKRAAALVIKTSKVVTMENYNDLFDQDRTAPSQVTQEYKLHDKKSHDNSYDTLDRLS